MEAQKVTTIKPTQSKSRLIDWLTTVDHKKIGILYLAAGGFFFLFGLTEAILMRLQLMFPENEWFIGGTYNQILTLHGTTMIFLAAMPILIGFMNLIVPLQIGARDVAFPFINALGFWLFFFGGLMLYVSLFTGGAPDAGWTAYPPLSLSNYSGTGLDYYVLGLQISGIGTLIGGINFLVTIINMRAPGMTFMRMPLFTWSSFVTSAMILFAFPPLTVALFMLMMDRLFGGNFFNPAAGGNPVIWQHLFWVFGHPEVYILILPPFGIFSEIASTFSGKRLFGYSAMVFATVMIAFFGFMVWAHHMFTVGLGPVANSIFAIATMLVGVPTGIKVFNWLFTLWGGHIRFTTASLWLLGFLPTFVIGGMTGVMLAVAPADYQYHDSYFVVAHFHYVIIGGVLFAIFGGLYYWWPKVFGKMLNETLGKWHFWLFFIGFHGTFFPLHFAGVMGMPRRVYTYLGNHGFDWINFVSTVSSFLMVAGVIVLLINLVGSSKSGKIASADPWDGRTLEWTIPSPPPVYNFAQLPLVRSLDAFWAEKMANKKEMTPAEPLGDIHMPSNSILPFIMSLGLFIAGFGIIYLNIWVIVPGLATTVVCMIIRSLKDDPGYHIHLK